ncbi:MAG: ATP-binding protein [Prolixibacteraceae bacterium]|nr:ATP-binding protein [Prolixibacteraceae bacterium]
MITRRIKNEIYESLDFFPVVSIIGPRQVGKTTLAKQLMSEFPKTCIYLDLEMQSDLYKLNDAELFLSQHADYLVVIDEVQNKKELYPQIRGLIDQKREPARFLLLGSASPELIRHSSESLAGRIAYHKLNPFDLNEIPESISQNDLWIKGGFPDALLTKKSKLSHRWMDNFINTYLNRDLIQLGLNASSKTIRNLWNMMAHLNGQLLNATTISNSLGVTTPTVKRYIDFLEEAFLLRSLHPYHWNISKRLVKAPKIYLADTGVLHHLLGISDLNDLSGNPIIGNSWEAFVINQVIALLPDNIDINFYRTYQGAEVDLVFTRGMQVVASAEIKYSNSPQLTKGNIQAFDDLKAPNNYIITPSSDDYLFKERVRVCSLKTFLNQYLPSF